MMKNAIINKRIGLIILWLFSVIVIGCAGTPRLATIPEDFVPTDEENSYQTILVLRTIIFDKTGSEEFIVLPINYNIDCGSSWGTNCIWHRSKTACDHLKDSKKYYDRCIKALSSSFVDYDWSKKDGARYFNEIAITKLIPNNCELYNIHLPLKGGSYGRYLALDIKRTYEFKPKKLYYLGVVRVDLESAFDGNYNYKLNIFQDDKTFEYDMKLFKSRYPKLYDYFKDSIVRIYPPK